MSDKIKELQEAIRVRKEKRNETEAITTRLMSEQAIGTIASALAPVVPASTAANSQSEQTHEADIYKNEEQDDIVLYESNTPTIDKIQSYLLEQINSVGKNLPEKMRESAIDNAYESMLWEYIKNIPVPDALIKKREGSDGKMYDYFPEFFHILFLYSME